MSHESKAADEYKHVLALRWQRSTPVKAYLVEQQNKVLFVGNKTQQQREDGRIDYTQRRNLIQALSDAANNERDTLRRSKILATIADLQRMKQDENKEEKDLVHFFLPLRCSDCELHKQEEARQANKQ